LFVNLIIKSLSLNRIRIESLIYFEGVDKWVIAV